MCLLLSFEVLYCFIIVFFFLLFYLFQSFLHFVVQSDQTTVVMDQFILFFLLGFVSEVLEIFGVKGICLRLENFTSLLGVGSADEGVFNNSLFLAI
jgi:hypothetical protein